MSWASPPVQSTGDIISASTWNSNFSWLYDTGWLGFGATLAYGNSWTDVQGPVAGLAGYRRIGNIVRFGGQITGGTSGTSPFTMASGYRPTVYARMTGVTMSTATDVAMVQVASTGIVLITWTGSGTGICLDDMTYTLD